jgi:hypothetical protein
MTFIKLESNRHNRPTQAEISPPAKIKEERRGHIF